MHGPVADSVCRQGHCDSWTVKGTVPRLEEKDVSKGKGRIMMASEKEVCRVLIREAVIGNNL